MRKILFIWPSIAGFEDGGRQPQIRIHEQPLDAENQLPVDSQQGNEDLGPTTTGSGIMPTTQMSKKVILP